MKIGELAKLTDCQVETIRYYEKEGLLPPPARSDGNYRLYTQAHTERLVFIRNCRSLDMTLEEIRSLLGLRDSPQDQCESVNALIDEHIHHAICAATSRFVGSLDLLPIAGYAVNPMSCDYPRLANKNETPMDRRPIWNGDGPRPPIDVVRNGHIYTPGIDGDFGQVHSSWARIYAEESVNLPEHWIEASQALLILSQYFTQHGLLLRAAKVWRWTSGS